MKSLRHRVKFCIVLGLDEVVFMMCIKSYLYSWFFGPLRCPFVILQFFKEVHHFKLSFLLIKYLIYKQEKTMFLVISLQKYTEYFYKKCNYTNTLPIKLLIFRKAKAAKKLWIYFWNVVPLCLIRCIWREHNRRTFENLNRSND